MSKGHALWLSGRVRDGACNGRVIIVMSSRQLVSARSDSCKGADVTNTVVEYVRRVDLQVQENPLCDEFSSQYAELLKARDSRPDESAPSTVGMNS